MISDDTVKQIFRAFERNPLPEGYYQQNGSALIPVEILTYGLWENVLEEKDVVDFEWGTIYRTYIDFGDTEVFRVMPKNQSNAETESNDDN
jgi:hypothetical protein